MRLPPGTVLKDQYQVDEFVAEGGTSVIYLGHPLRGAGQVALKELRPLDDAAEYRESVAQFRREYDVLKNLSHSGLPHVIDCFEDNGRQYLIEEFVSGESLETVLEREGRLPWQKVVTIGVELLDVLKYLHRQNIIYRDLKPANILLMPNGRVRLVDFGAVRRWKLTSRADTVPLGTPGYAAPEQYGGAQTDARTDIYSLGVVLHHMLTGLGPTRMQDVPSETGVAATRPLVTPTREPWTFKAPSSLVPEIPHDLSLLVIKAVDFIPQQRYSSASHMDKDLKAVRLQTHAPRPARPATPVLSPAVALPGLREQIRFRSVDDYFEAQYFNPGCALGGVFVFASLEDFIYSVIALTVIVGIHWLAEHILRERARPKVLALCNTYKDFTLQVFDDAFHLFDGITRVVNWDDLDEMVVLYSSHYTRVLELALKTRSGTLTLSGEWPGTVHTIDAVLKYTDLVAQPAPQRNDRGFLKTFRSP